MKIDANGTEIRVMGDVINEDAYFSLTDVAKCKNPDNLLEQAKSNIYEGRKLMADSRTNMDHANIKFEILTELCDDYKKCEKCSFSPCIVKK